MSEDNGTNGTLAGKRAVRDRLRALLAGLGPATTFAQANNHLREDGVEASYHDFCVARKELWPDTDFRATTGAEAARRLMTGRNKPAGSPCLHTFAGNGRCLSCGAEVPQADTPHVVTAEERGFDL